MIYQTDGSFEGLLTAIYQSYYEEWPDHIVLSEVAQGSLLVSSKRIITDPQKASRVAKAIDQKLGRPIFTKILRAYFSEREEAGDVILSFLSLAFKEGKKMIEAEAHPLVSPLLKLQRKVDRELHLLLGLVRFSVLAEGILYAEVKSTYYQLPMLAGHFAQRLASEAFIIHDIQRHEAVIYRDDQWKIVPFYLEDLPALDQEELDIRRLWQEYFQRIAIKERENPRLQRNMMPKKYWPYLTEMRKDLL